MSQKQSNSDLTTEVELYSSDDQGDDPNYSDCADNLRSGSSSENVDHSTLNVEDEKSAPKQQKLIPATRDPICRVQLTNL